MRLALTLVPAPSAACLEVVSDGFHFVLSELPPILVLKLDFLKVVDIVGVERGGAGESDGVLHG